MSIAIRYRLLIGLLLGTLLLSVALNFYCLQQLEAAPDYAADAELTVAEAELELAHTRARLAVCEQATRYASGGPDSLARP